MFLFWYHNPYLRPEQGHRGHVPAENPSGSRGSAKVGYSRGPLAYVSGPARCVVLPLCAIIGKYWRTYAYLLLPGESRDDERGTPRGKSARIDFLYNGHRAVAARVCGSM